MYFLINDDSVIEGVLSGRFTGTPDGHAVYLRYPLSWLLSKLYSLLPGIPWYGLFLLSCYVFAFLAFGCACYKKLGKRYICYTGFAAAALFLLLPNFITVHYTVATAALAAGAIMLTLAEGPMWLTALAMGLCYCLRKEVFLLAIPFWGAVLLWKVLQKPCNYKKWGYLVLATLGLTGMFMGINSLVYRSDTWQDFLQYNDARTQLYDYEWFVPYEDQPEAYEAQGISERDFTLIASYELMLEEDLTAEDFEKVMAANAGNVWVDTPMHTLKRMLVKYRDWVLHPTEAYTWIAIAIYAVLLGLLLWRRAWLQALLVLCLGMGRSVIWIYLFMKGRFPEHVMLSLFVLEFAVLFGFLLEEVAANTQGKRKTVVTILCAVLALGFGAGALYDSVEAVQRQVAQGRKRAEFEPLREYFEEHPEEVYLLDIVSMWDYSQGVLETGPRLQNYFLAGGWASGSPMANQRFAQIGAADGADALLRLSQVHYVIEKDRAYDWLELYLGEPVKRVEQIGEFKILSWH